MTSKSREEWEKDLNDKIRKLGYKGKIPINLVLKKKLLEKLRNDKRQLEQNKKLISAGLDNGEPRKKPPYWPMDSETKY